MRFDGVVGGNAETGEGTWKRHALKTKPKGLTCNNDQALRVSKVIFATLCPGLAFLLTELLSRSAVVFNPIIPVSRFVTNISMNLLLSSEINFSPNIFAHIILKILTKSFIVNKANCRESG